MKTALAVTLVICGTFVVALPPASDYLYNRTVARIMIEKPDSTSVTLHGQMDSTYRFGCWALGAAMIGAGILASGFSTQPSRASAREISPA